jgi:hypothetical protein
LKETKRQEEDFHKQDFVWRIKKASKRKVSELGFFSRDFQGKVKRVLRDEGKKSFSV